MFGCDDCNFLFLEIVGIFFFLVRLFFVGVFENCVCVLLFELVLIVGIFGVFVLFFFFVCNVEDICGVLLFIVGWFVFLSDFLLLLFWLVCVIGLICFFFVVFVLWLLFLKISVELSNIEVVLIVNFFIEYLFNLLGKKFIFLLIGFCLCLFILYFLCI